MISALFLLTAILVLAVYVNFELRKYRA